MTFKTRELTVDLVNEISTNEIRFSQGDENSAKLVLNITNQGQELDLSKATAVRITFEKSDGTTVFQQDCQVINAMKGKYQIVLKTQTLAVIGNVYGQVQIIEGDQKIDSQVFVFTVKRSLSSNEAVESKNEFTIIQKALEVGEKFQNVDFGPIIAAGALAQGSLPKAGGTMTGHISFDKDKGVYFRNTTTGAAATLYGDAVAMIFRDLVNSGNIFTYNYSTKTFDLTATNTNVYKKTDLYPNMVQPNGRAIVLAANADLNDLIDTGIYAGGSTVTNMPEGRAEWMYIEVVRHAETYSKQIATTLSSGSPQVWMRARNNGAWGNWIKIARDADKVNKAGDTMTGNLDVPRVNTSNSIPLLFNGVASATVSWKTSVLGEGLVFTPAKTTGATDWDDTKKVAISSKGEVTAQAFKTPKDGRATITVTADAELIGANGVIADRRGNTVTVRAPIRRKIGSTSALMFTLPVDMRPTMELTENVISISGSVGLVTVSTNGNFQLGSAMLNDLIPGKDFNITVTYVVD
ncbi:DUF2479 domain-containing protein [Bacillus cereus]|uniref:BppU family phage baseplate upper protein n=1 Tax=Bacillus luti TaxID=2026191 RepID=A0ABU8HWV0_9BACI|nr:BppU family phage baseplate upper protein [Bacillus luti]RGN77225.1 DUF2479 domain-containing protein [Bacillus cereus]